MNICRDRYMDFQYYNVKFHQCSNLNRMLSVTKLQHYSLQTTSSNHRKQSLYVGTRNIQYNCKHCYFRCQCMSLEYALKVRLDRECVKGLLDRPQHKYLLI